MGYEAYFEGKKYGLDTEYGEFLGMSYRTPAAGISLATDPRTANQLKAVSEKLSAGAQAVEVQMTMPEVAESIPNQHLEELNRLRKLTGAEFTLHGPLVEPTGVTKQGWDETHREQAERQMWSAVERGHKLDPKGNIVVTFHTSNGLPEPEVKEVDEKGNEVIKAIFTVDDRTGQFGQIAPKENYLLGKPADPYGELERENREAWTAALGTASFHAHSGENAIREIVGAEKKEIPEEIRKYFKDIDFSKLYKLSKTPEGEKFISDLKPEARQFLQSSLHALNYGEIHVRQAYQELQNLYNRSWVAAERDNRKEDLKKLKHYREEIKDKITNFDSPENVAVMADEVARGINMLNSIQQPQLVRPLKEFAIDKASETFSNIALKAYNKFGDSSPVISIENPPAGSGITRAEDIKELIEETRRKFVEKAVEKGISEEKARRQAEKLIGATWDVGHINMLRKFGYEEKHLIEQTKQIAPYVKNIHLSDNFGMEHTELPMGMGNVPTKKHMEILDEYNRRLKKIVETGNWYQHFQTTPLKETFAALGSPIAAAGGAPYWNQAYDRLSGGYFGGFGLNPEIHHSVYGAGFSGLPVELGGQIPGRQSRLSGTPME